MEQWNMKFGDWRIGSPFEYCDLNAERKNYKGVTYTLEEMLRERFLSKCLLEWDERMGRKFEWEKRNRFKCKNVKRILKSKSQEKLERICERIVKRYDVIESTDIAEILRERDREIEYMLVEEGIKYEMESYLSREKKRLLGILEALLGDYREKLLDNRIYSLTRINVLFFNYLLDAYETGEIKVNISNKKIIKANGYFWYQVKRGMDGLIHNKNMTLSKKNVKERLEKVLCVPYIELVEEIAELKAMLDEIEKLPYIASDMRLCDYTSRKIQQFSITIRNILVNQKGYISLEDVFEDTKFLIS